MFNIDIAPLVKYLVGVIVVITLFCGTYMKGCTDGKAIASSSFAQERVEWQAKVNEASDALGLKIAGITATYNADLARNQEEINKLRGDLQWQKDHPRVVTKTVRQYVPLGVDAIMPKGFVELHNTAAKGKSLSGDDRPDASKPSDQLLSDVASTVGTNYYNCVSTRNQLLKLQEVVKEYQKAQGGLTR